MDVIGRFGRHWTFWTSKLDVSSRPYASPFVERVYGKSWTSVGRRWTLATSIRQPFCRAASRGVWTFWTSKNHTFKFFVFALGSLWDGRRWTSNLDVFGRQLTSIRQPFCRAGLREIVDVSWTSLDVGHVHTSARFTKGFRGQLDVLDVKKPHFQIFCSRSRDPGSSLRRGGHFV